ncbi:MAG: hypothetical protein EOP83_02610 [Verrucomicrobiaceae bacterium]|nr:MAG: hypothetical protein EOP83_02610 [Verrucomicrobiaceae bacterium]
MITIACVYKANNTTSFGGQHKGIGANYDVTWVQKLARGVEKHIQEPHQFICLSDVEVPGVETFPLFHDWPGWWSKLELFRPGLFDGPVLYFDLDVMLTGDLTAMTGPFDNMVMLSDIYPHIDNSSCMWWDASNVFYGNIYTSFARDPQVLSSIYNTVQKLGDQAYISEIVTFSGYIIDRWQSVLPKDWFVPYSFSSQLNPMVRNGLPEDARLVYSLGAPKFDHPPVLDFVKEHWV